MMDDGCGLYPGSETRSYSRYAMRAFYHPELRNEGTSPRLLIVLMMTDDLICYSSSHPGGGMQVTGEQADLPSHELLEDQVRKMSALIFSSLRHCLEDR